MMRRAPLTPSFASLTPSQLLAAAPLLALALALPAGAQSELPRSAPRPAGNALPTGAPAPGVKPAGTAAPAAQNVVEELVRQRKFEDALAKIKELRTAAKKPLADPESEYWAARAESQMKLVEAARARFQAIARTYPDHPRGIAAAIEQTTVRLNALGEGRADTPDEIKVATECAKELEATAAKLKDPEGISRAWYVAGNAWRTMGDDASAAVNYEKSLKVAGAKDYPGKSLYSLATGALQRFDVAGARRMLDDCIKKYPESSSLDKCAKAQPRLDIIGQAAPPLDVETWVNGPPQDMASLKGKVVLVWFFATWCPHCKATMPEIAAMKKRFAGKPLAIIGVTNNSKDQTTEKAAAFVADPQWQITYPAAVDNAGATTIAYEAGGIPAAVLVDKKGVIRWADHPTYLNDAMVEKLLAE